MRRPALPTPTGLLVVLTILSPGGVRAQTAPTTRAAAPPPAIGCPSLANLRILLRRTSGDQAAAASLVSDDRADTLGCTMLGPDKVTAIIDRAAFDGQAYECAGLQTTTICHWTLAGSVAPAPPRPPPPGREKARR